MYLTGQAAAVQVLNAQLAEPSTGGGDRGALAAQPAAIVLPTLVGLAGLVLILTA